MGTILTNLDCWFRISDRGSTVKKEVWAGTIIFFTMAYILAVNPNILSASGMDSTAVMLATCIASAVGTFLMGILANLPFAMSAGMGLNAYFAYTVVIGMGYAWEKALLAVFVEGIIFVILSLTGVREAIFNAIPHNLKVMVSVAIGLFIAFIGLQNVHMAVGNDSTLVSLASFHENFNSAGMTIILFLIGVAITGVLLACRVPGAMLIGIIVTWGVGIGCELAGGYVPNPDIGYYSLMPHLTAPNFSALGLTFGKCFTALQDFHGASDVLQFAGVVFAFLFVDIFDTLGTLTGGAVAGNMLDEDGKLPEIKQALTADAVATSVGAICGTSTITTFVESTSGIVAGGRTGLTAIVTGIWFLISMFASSFFTSIPSFATAPALLIVGAMMLPSIKKAKLEADDYLELIPMFFCLIAMVAFYSISEGIAAGIISYVVLNLACKPINFIAEIMQDELSRERKPQWIKTHSVNPVMVVIAIAFILKYALL